MSFEEKTRFLLKSCFEEKTINNHYYVVVIEKTKSKNLISHLLELSFLIYDDNSFLYVCMNNTKFNGMELTSPQHICCFFTWFLYEKTKELCLCNLIILQKNRLSLNIFLYQKIKESFENYLISKKIDISQTLGEIKQNFDIPNTKEVYGIFYSKEKTGSEILVSESVQTLETFNYQDTKGIRGQDTFDS